MEDREFSAVESILVTVRGRVQGVGFRAWAQREAAALGLTGWVRNLPDGSVELFIQPPDGQGVHGAESEAVRTLLARLGRGPSLAKVTDILTQPPALHPRVERFEVRR